MQAPEGKRRPFLVRIFFGLLGGGTFSAILFCLPSYAFAIGVALISVLGAQELYKGVRRQEAEPTEFLGYFACIIFQFVAWKNGGGRFLAYLPAVLLLLVLTSLVAELVKPRQKPILNVGSMLLGAVYVGWLSSYVTLMRSTTFSGLHVPGYTTLAQWLVYFVACTTWFSDAGALFIGSAFGRHKLAPAISPAKTLEGAIGGLLCAWLIGLVVGHAIHLPVAHILILATICAVSGLLGDLFESAFKRDLRMKDFGKVLPGHGGVLDRIDSILVSAPLAYYYILFVLGNQHIIVVH